MSVSMLDSAFVVSGAQTLALSAMFQTSSSGTNPEYIVLSVIDRNRYTADATEAVGTLTGNGHTLSPTQVVSFRDERGAGIIFTYQAATGTYTNSTYGDLDKMQYTASASASDVTSLSLYGTDTLAAVQGSASYPYAMMYSDPAGFIGSVTVATQATFTGTVPDQATPLSIAAGALSHVGEVCNVNGCWILASTIAAEAGAGLPVTTTLTGIAGQASGEWIVAYNGPAGDTRDWISMLKAGEMVSLNITGASGHIATVVSGSGANALVVDNAAFATSTGAIANAANDGDADDVIIASPHSEAAEFAKAVAGSVVIYELDAPIVTALISTATIGAGASLALAASFTAAEPGTRTITAYQAYDTLATDSFSVGGVITAAHSAANAVTAASLGVLNLVAGAVAGVDTVMLRAFNGAYWGDWTSTSVTVAVAAATPTVAPTVVAAPVVAAAPVPTVAAPIPGEQVTNTTTQVTTAVPFNAYSGPVAGVTNEYIDVTNANLNIVASTPSSFISTGSGFDAIDVHAAGGRNVLDGGTGSNFLTGGTGSGSQDSFFVDNRNASADIWSSILNFHAGDDVTVFGVTQATSTLTWADNQGAAGFSGLTLHVATAGKPTASFTLANDTTADLTNGHLSLSFGTVDGSSYLYIAGH